MRIVHLSTFDCAGGAARAAFRLHKGLLEQGVQSSMLVQKKTSSLDSVYEASCDEKILKFWRWLEEFYVAKNRTEISNTFFSLGYPGTDLTKHPAVLQADIIHLHWVAGFQSAVSLAALQTLGKPIAWSCHDERAFTGGCHYTFGSQGFTRDCADCPQLRDDPMQITAANLSDQKALVDPAGVTIVALSQWIKQSARASAQYNQSRVDVIPNGLETETFVPTDRVEERKKLGLSADTFCLLFGADAIGERRKGFQELLAALRICSNDEQFATMIREQKVVLLCFGHLDKSVRDFPIPVRSMGYIQSDEQMARLYSAADLFVLPSLQDNLPNTMLESMSCGTPVMGFNVGGIPDVVQHGVTGVLVDAADSKGLANAILDAVKNPSRITAMRPACRKKIEDQFTLLQQAKNFRALYDDLLKEKAPQPKIKNIPPLLGPEFAKRFPNLVSICIERFAADQPYWESKANATRNGQIEQDHLHAILARFNDSNVQHWVNEFAAGLDFILAERKRHKRRLSSRIKRLLIKRK